MINDSFSFISYFYDKDPSKSVFYKDNFFRLKHQLESYGHTLYGENIDFNKMGLSAYDKLNLYKPTYIIKKINELKTPVIWIDADCSVYDKITEFDDPSCDIGFALREHDRKTPHAAFIYFSNSNKSLNFLKMWEDVCETKKYVEYDCTEHCLLVDLFNTIDDSYNILKYNNLATISLNSKIKIGISPAGWEYEKNK